ncbi:hypothetical protein WJX84_001407 [Apatococcus fuscideae]|uniref:Uncharacterized protein n=1 Tax=Apatococcus fuscideae TaxID=2026836 RepID=A0AAW1S3Q5_9CHLO
MEQDGEHSRLRQEVKAFRSQAGQWRGAGKAVANGRGMEETGARIASQLAGPEELAEARAETAATRAEDCTYAAGQQLQASASRATWQCHYQPPDRTITASARCSSWVGGWKSKSVMCPYNILKAAERRASLPVPPETLMQPSGNKRQYPSDAVSAAEPKRQQTAPGIEVAHRDCASCSTTAEFG